MNASQQLRRTLPLAGILYLLAGCRVVTPAYHLPQGYSETYRRNLLGEANVVCESAVAESPAVAAPPPLPAPPSL